MFEYIFLAYIAGLMTALLCLINTETVFGRQMTFAWALVWVLGSWISFIAWVSKHRIRRK